ncbi:MAG: PKD domain-containing protein [Planctomycetota bacterium]|jgi:murein DD-endopeptidase MepM/ murein hydrolase activator NlpD
MSRITIQVSIVMFMALVCRSSVHAQAPLLFETVDLNVNETQQVTLSDGQTVAVKLTSLEEVVDPIRGAVRRATVKVEVNGEAIELVSATYNRPQRVGGVRIDCPITRGYNAKSRRDSWGLDADARLRLWAADSPLLRPGTFRYPVRQRWFATHTQMANVPTYVDGGESPASNRSIYYHSGLDIGGVEGAVDVIAATDGLVVSVGEDVLPEHAEDTPVSPRYDVVYLLDGRGWYYRYSHLQTIDPSLAPGNRIRMGDAVGVLGKEGGSGGWSHLHFEIKARQPSGRWGTQEGYAFLWEAYVSEYRPRMIAVARPHELIWAGETATLDGRKSWSAEGKIVTYEWTFDDGAILRGPVTQRSFDRPGSYSVVMRVTDSSGASAYDFATVQVLDPNHPDRLPPTIHPAYAPTTGIGVGDEITFKVRTFRTQEGAERWDFGDGSPPVIVRSDGNAVKLAPDGYAVTTHRYDRPGDYIVRVERTNDRDEKAVAHLYVRVEK